MKQFYFSLLLICSAQASVNAQFNADGTCSPGVYSSNFYAPPDALIRSTMRFEIIEGATRRGRCTGSLINQLVNGKPRQLFVTARHCIHEGQNGEGRLYNLNNAELVFNFQSNNGNTDAIPDVQPFFLGNRGEDIRFRYAFRSPVQLLYESSAIVVGSYSFGVDIAMMEIMTPIPPHFNVYYAGWKADALLGPGGVLNAPMKLVQHPAGDAKKFAVTPYVAKLENPIATTCRTITKVLDAIIRLFGGKSVTESICSYVDVPQYEIPIFTTGAIRGGTSGSPFFTNGNRIFGVFSADLAGGLANGNCVNVGLLTAGKFRNAYANRSMRDNLNPSYDIGANLFGMDGRQMGCYPDNPLRLSGEYFPARDYQPNNQVVISATQAIEAGQVDTDGNNFITAAFDYNPTTGQPQAPTTNLGQPVTVGLEERRLHIYNGADFVFTAGQTIRLLPGFTVDAGGNFSARIQDCYSGGRLGASGAESMATPVVNTTDKEPLVLTLTPNPTTGSVTCRYMVRQPGNVQLNLLNTEGKEVLSLLTLSSQQGGIYEVERDLSTLSTGIYLVQLKTEDGIETKRLLIQH